MTRRSEVVRAVGWGAALTTLLAALIVVGSQDLAHFDAALVAYTFATLFATFGIGYRYAMWLERPPTRMYWSRGWRAFLDPRRALPHLLALVRRGGSEIALNRFIFARGALRGATHMLIMWGCILAAAITFPLVWGWIHTSFAPCSRSTSSEPRVRSRLTKQFASASSRRAISTRLPWCQTSTVRLSGARDGSKRSMMT